MFEFILQYLGTDDPSGEEFYQTLPRKDLIDLLNKTQLAYDNGICTWKRFEIYTEENC